MSAPNTSLQPADEDRSLTQAKLFHYLQGKLELLAKDGGKLTLRMASNGGTVDIDSFPVKPASTWTTDEIKKLAGQIEQEAESALDGSGGGKKTFSLASYRNGERKTIGTCIFAIEIEGDGPLATDDDTSVRGQLAMQMKHNQTMAQSMMQMFQMMMSAMKIQGEGQARIIEAYQRTQVDNLVMLRANIENQIGNEAQAVATLQNSKDWNELFQMAKPLIEAAGMTMMMKLAEKNGN